MFIPGFLLGYGLGLLIAAWLCWAATPKRLPNLRVVGGACFVAGLCCLAGVGILLGTGELEGAEAERWLVTAYCPCERCCGEWADGQTYWPLPDGTDVATFSGKIVAVDPRAIPFGSRVRVEGFGDAQALDKGSAIKGRRLDVLMLVRAADGSIDLKASHEAALQWGKQLCRVDILRKGPPENGSDESQMKTDSFDTFSKPLCYPIQTAGKESQPVWSAVLRFEAQKGCSIEVSFVGQRLCSGHGCLVPDSLFQPAISDALNKLSNHPAVTPEQLARQTLEIINERIDETQSFSWKGGERPRVYQVLIFKGSHSYSYVPTPEGLEDVE